MTDIVPKAVKMRNVVACHNDHLSSIATALATAERTFRRSTSPAIRDIAVRTAMQLAADLESADLCALERIKAMRRAIRALEDTEPDLVMLEAVEIPRQRREEPVQASQRPPRMPMAALRVPAPSEAVLRGRSEIELNSGQHTTSVSAENGRAAEPPAAEGAEEA